MAYAERVIFIVTITVVTIDKLHTDSRCQTSSRVTPSVMSPTCALSGDTADRGGATAKQYVNNDNSN